jgi:hypothetical protein
MLKKMPMPTKKQLAAMTDEEIESMAKRLKPLIVPVIEQTAPVVIRASDSDLPTST